MLTEIRSAFLRLTCYLFRWSSREKGALATAPQAAADLPDAHIIL